MKALPLCLFKHFRPDENLILMNLLSRIEFLLRIRRKQGLSNVCIQVRGRCDGLSCVVPVGLCETVRRWD